MTGTMETRRPAALGWPDAPVPAAAPAGRAVGIGWFVPAAPARRGRQISSSAPLDRPGPLDHPGLQEHAEPLGHPDLLGHPETPERSDSLGHLEAPSRQESWGRAGRHGRPGPQDEPETWRRPEPPSRREDHGRPAVQGRSEPQRREDSWSVPERDDAAVRVARASGADAAAGDAADAAPEGNAQGTAVPAAQEVAGSDQEGVDVANGNQAEGANVLETSRARIRNVLDGAVGVSRETESDFDTPIAREAAQAVRVLNPSGDAKFPRPTRRRLITIANQKGGVGKTTSTVNLAVAFALHGLRVLVIDLDPQGNTSTGLGIEHSVGVQSIYEVLVDGESLTETAVQVEQAPNLWCVPATIDLAGAEIELVSMVARESRLKAAIEAYENEVDYILVDCPPSLGLLTVNALVAADEVLIPIQCEYYALEGLGQLLKNIELIQAHLNARLRVSTILLTMYDRRTKLADQVAQEVRNHFGGVVLDAVIPRSVRVSEAPGYGQSVMTYDPGSKGALTYFEAAREIAERGAGGSQESRRATAEEGSV